MRSHILVDALLYQYSALASLRYLLSSACIYQSDKTSSSQKQDIPYVSNVITIHNVPGLWGPGQPTIPEMVKASSFHGENKVTAALHGLLSMALHFCILMFNTPELYRPFSFSFFFSFFLSPSRFNFSTFGAWGALERLG